jgi:thioredoxin-like negative regulator of GroEL
MSKTLKHHKRKQRRANKTQRRTGGRHSVFNGNQSNMAELDALLSQPDHHVLAKHYSDTCTHCKDLEPEWENVMRSLKPHSSFTIANLDQDATDHMNEHHYRKHNYGVNGVPTIVYINKIKTSKPKEYQGELVAKQMMDWFAKTVTDKRLKITIESDMQASGNNDVHSEEPEMAFPAVPPPSAASDENPFDQEAQASTESASASALTETNSFDQVPAPEPALSPATPAADETSLVQDPTIAATTAADAFPPAPLPPASTLSKATDTIKTTAATIDNNIEQGVNTVKSALTRELDIGNPFSSDTKNKDLMPVPVNVPAVPSLVGGISHRRRCTRRKNRRSKSKKRSKKSKSKK